MTRVLIALGIASGLGCCVLAALPGSAVADDLPIRKAGLWEIKMVRTGSPLPAMTMQQCTDETTDRAMNTVVSPLTKQACSKQELKKTATGYVSDSVCNMGAGSTTAHADITGDFNSAYTMTTTLHSEGGPSGVPRDTTMAIEAKWLGACKPDQKPGDIVMPGGGFKINVKDADKLKGLLPGAK
jgi:Protein of unknown function (DUF3617)